MTLTSLRYGLTFEMGEARIISVVVEAPSVLENLVFDLKAQLDKKEEHFLFLQAHEKAVLEKRAVLIGSPFDFSYDKKVLQKKIFAELMQDPETEKRMTEITEIWGEVLEKMEDVAVYSDLPLGFIEEIFAADIFKSFQIHLKDPEGSFSERLMAYGETLQRLLGKDIFFFCNCGAYLSKEDILYIMKWASYRDIRLFFIDGHRLPRHPDINEYILDSDLCLIH